MDKKLSWKILLIIALVVLAAWELYPPHKTLKRGIDIGGGTSLIYEIDAKGMSSGERTGLSQRMITVLRRRIDPANIQNMIWRPQGNTRFEIQVPLASTEARQKRQQYEQSLNELLAENVPMATIMRSMAKPADQRAADIEKFARDSNDKKQILDSFAKIYDQRKTLQQQRDELAGQMQTPEGLIKLAGFNLDDIKQKVIDWSKLDETKLKEELEKYPGGAANVEMLAKYTDMYRKWALVVGQLTDPDTGINMQYNRAMLELHKLNLSQDQVTLVLDMAEPGNANRNKAIDALRAEFSERAGKIDMVIKAYDEYYPFRGRLDDPGDIQRMLKGAGILEFRILPTEGHPDVDSAQMKTYVDTLKAKGPRFASDDKYIWYEIEKPDEWKSGDSAGRPTIVAQFGSKFYVLASNRKDETVLHTGQAKDWRLVRATPGQDQMGRRSIDFELDERGGRIFANVTGKNLERPLCILLDNIALSAPNIQSRIYTRGQITGTFSNIEVDDMVSKLNAGSLPARLIEQPISVKTIGPSIGEDNLKKGVKAAIIGLAAVLACMLTYYTIGGSVADMALIMNVLFTLAIMAGLRATFTLPGIAGLILTIGMSVDANVLIFERMREEQEKGASLAIAIKNGYNKAFSAIFDSNLTTIMTAAILYWVASEEIKGFALTLMLGLASSMFTALFVTHVALDWLHKNRIIKDHIVMLRLIRKPNIDWMKYRPVFFAISAITTIGGLTLFFSRDNSKYDIEFTGGTSVQINLKQNVDLTRQQVEDLIHQKGTELKNDALASATIYSVGTSGKEYEINTRETNRTLATITLPEGKQLTPEAVIDALKKSEAKSQRELGKLSVTPAGAQSFAIGTSQLSTQFVADILSETFPDANISDPKVNQIVTDAVLSAFEGKLEVLQNLHPEITGADKITESIIETHPEFTDYLEGVKITCRLGVPVLGSEIQRRFGDIRLKPDLRELHWYQYTLFDTEFKPLDPNTQVSSFIYASASPEAGVGEISEDVWKQFVDNETTKVTAAMALAASLPQVTQIDPVVGREGQRQALVAIVLSLIAMLIYLAIRFGDLRYGIGAIVKLIHDTCTTLGLVSACVFIAATSVGQLLLIGDFKIDMTMIAAFLTLLGYSINDSIVIYDRIRENRRKDELSPQIINNSINDCMSRTILTGTTTLLVLLVMYIFSGKGLRGFNFTMLFGIVIGTYSSVAISVPILLLGKKIRQLTKSRTEGRNPQPAK